MKTQLLLTFCLLLSFSVHAEEEINTKPLKATSGPITIQIGQPSSLSLQISLDEPYKAYSDKFQLKVLSPTGIDVQKVEVGPIVTFIDPNTKTEKAGVKGEGRLTAELTATTMPAESEIILEITYQACTDRHCLFPTKYEVRAPLTKTKPAASKMSFESALEKGLLYTFVFVFLAGILTSFTPCIFPMIPITLSIIGASQIRHMPGSDTAIKKRSRWRGFTLSLAYVHGIAFTYALLGVIAANTGALFGSALSNPWVVSAISLIFVAMALSMYGLYEIQMPAFIRNKLGATKTDAGYVGAFIAGLIAGIVASPCVGPVLVGLLAHVAQTQDAVLGFFLLFTFAMGMGLLLIAVGTFSSLSSKLPKSGGWMNFVKFIFGTAMLAMALYYIYPLLKPMLPKGIVSSEMRNSEWKNFDEAQFEAALASGKPVVVDFYADWCAACKELEKFTFSNPQVKAELKNFELFRLDMTTENETTARLKERFKILGLPTMHFYNGGELRTDLTLTGYEAKNEFLVRLKKVLSNNN